MNVIDLRFFISFIFENEFERNINLHNEMLILLAEQRKLSNYNQSTFFFCIRDEKNLKIYLLIKKLTL